jgi:hypothetical protein
MIEKAGNITAVIWCTWNRTMMVLNATKPPNSQKHPTPFYFFATITLVI